jgi:hypothetical protein
MTLRWMPFFVVLTLPWALAHGRPAPTLSVKTKATSAQITVSISKQSVFGLRKGKMPYTAESFHFAVRVSKPEIDEADIFGSGLALDLDGDGKTKSVLPVTCHRDGSASAGKTTFTPLGWPEMNYRPNGKSVVKRIGKRGAESLLYRACSQRGDAFVGVSKVGKPIVIHQVDGPVLMLMLVTEVKKPGKHGSLKLVKVRNGTKPTKVNQTHRVWVYEPIFSAQPSWSEAVMVTIPLATTKAQKLTISVSGLKSKQRYLAIGSINYSPGKHRRRRLKVGAKLFYAP